MASSSSSAIPSARNNPNPSSNPQIRTDSEPNSEPNTTFVQTDPSSFRAVVQRLTGAAAAPPSFKLHERRRTARRLEIKLDANRRTPNYNSSSRNHRSSLIGEITNCNAASASPVSTLEAAAGRRSPTTPVEEEEEERAIVRKRFYLHPNPRGSDPPELLPLFPLSPKDG